MLRKIGEFRRFVIVVAAALNFVIFYSFAKRWKKANLGLEPENESSESETTSDAPPVVSRELL